MKGYWVTFKKWLKSEKISKNEYEKSYDTISSTYSSWEDFMNDQLVNIIPCYIKPDSIIVDLCTGTGVIVDKFLKIETNLNITGVDISKGMLEIAAKRFPGINFIQTDALDYLKSLKDSSIDFITCGWGLVYLDIPKVSKEALRVLKPGGSFSVILNRKGTLPKVESSIIKVMSKHPEEIDKIMDIRYSLPKSIRQLINWVGSGFTIANSGYGEKVVTHKNGKSQLKWLKTSGALAATEYIFKNNLDSEIEISLENSQKGDIKSIHRFLYATFIKE